MVRLFFLLLLCIISVESSAQVKILFDAKKGEQAGNADWIIDADVYNVCVGSSGYSTGGSCNESNPSRYPTPAQSGITSTTTEGYWSGAISSYAVECAKLGYIVETLPYTASITYGNTSNPQDLSNYRLFVVCEPNIVFTSAEKTAIMQYVQNGGRLLMVADHETSDRNGDGWESRTIWNDLMFNNSVQSNNPFGMKFDSVDIFQTTTNYTPNAQDSILNSSQFGSCTQMKFANGTTLTINPSLNSTVKGHFYATGFNKTTTGALVASCRFGKGKVVGFGDSSPFDDETGDANDNLYDGWITDASGNHRKIIMNATMWLVALDTFIAQISPSGNTAFCSGDSVKLTASTGTSYLWSNGKTTPSITVKTSGTYSVTVTNSLGQQSSASIMITAWLTPTPTITINGNKLETQSYFMNYLWYQGATPLSGANSYQYTPTSSGNYSVSVTDTNGCKGISPTKQFLLPFIATISKSKDSFCGGDSAMLTATMGKSYLWSTGDTTRSIKVKTSGNYSVTITDSFNRQSSANTSLFVRAKPSPTLTVIPNSEIRTQTGFKKYYWYVSNMLKDSSTYFYRPKESGIVRVVVRDSFFCEGSASIFFVIMDRIQEIESQFEIQIHDQNIVISPTANLPYFIRLIDLNGRIFYHKEVCGSHSISLSEYPAALLYIEISDKQGHRLVQKILK